uniref:Uncharacterized protein n=1 Tax=Panagrolaimus sp. ES5 TaxID=591445 RepID=A0AC34FLP6_9BILA
MANKKNITMSEDLLEMQFMRSTRQKLEEQAKKKQLTDIAEEYRGRKIPATKNKAKPSRYEFCPDIGYTELQDLRYGRFAFNGINPEIAKIQTEEEMLRLRKHDPKYENDEDIFKDIQDEEMAHSSFGQARQGRGVMIQPADQVLNIYAEESDKPASSTADENDGNSSYSAAAAASKPSPRYAPYKQHNPNRGRGGNSNYRGGGNARGSNSNHRGNSSRGGANNRENYRGKKK